MKPSISCLLFTLSISCISLNALAQKPTPNTEDANATYERIERATDRRNSIYIGSFFPDFSATTTGGRLINNTTLRNKVTLLVFWYPTCNCFDFKKLDRVQQAFKGRPDFQIIVLGADSSGLAAYKKTNPMPYTFASVGTERNMHDLNFSNGFTSFVVVNQAGSVSKILGHLFDPEAKSLIAHLHELLF